MRSTPGGRAAADSKVPDGGGAQYGSPGHGRLMPSSTRALSRTLRLTTPSTLNPAQPSPEAGPSDTRPRFGFSPNSPQLAAGMRIEPPPSLAWAMGTMPAATAAAEPPLDPPAECPAFQGLAVGP